MKLGLAASLFALAGLGRLVTMMYLGAVEGFACIGASHPHHPESTFTRHNTKRL